MLDEQPGRPKQMSHARMLQLAERGDIDAIERAVWRGELDDVRATLQARRLAQFEACEAESETTHVG